MVEVDPDDPGFQNQTKFVGPVYDKAEADRLAAEKGWVVKPDGAKWRRVVPSPLPKRIFEIRPTRWLLDQGTVVICAGGGIPTLYQKGADRKLIGVEAVIDKDLCSELLARELDADLFVMLTDADAVYLDWSTPTQRAIRRAPWDQKWPPRAASPRRPAKNRPSARWKTSPRSSQARPAPRFPCTVTG